MQTLFSAVVALLSVAAFFGLQAADMPEAAWLLQAGAMTYCIFCAGRWWQQRQINAAVTAAPARTYRIQETVKLRVPPRQVWALLKPAETAPLLNDEIVKGYQVPGTPDGVGEQQAYVMRDGTTVVSEVVEYVHERRAVTRLVSPRVEPPLYSTADLEPLGLGTLLTLGVTIEIPLGYTVAPLLHQQQRESLRNYARNVEKGLIEVTR